MLNNQTWSVGERVMSVVRVRAVYHEMRASGPRNVPIETGGLLIPHVSRSRRAAPGSHGFRNFGSVKIAARGIFIKPSWRLRDFHVKMVGAVFLPGTLVIVVFNLLAWPSRPSSPSGFRSRMPPRGSGNGHGVIALREG